MSLSNRIAMIGLDAADLGLIRSSSSTLPNMRRVLASGPIHTLRSPADILTGSVWPTFYTATSPGEHGIYHHLQWDAPSMRLRRLASDWFDCEPFWSELERRGRRVVAVDVPLLFPAHVRRGIEVLNWGSHDTLGPFACNPRSLEGEIRRRFGPHPMGCEIPVGKSAAELTGIRDALTRGARRKGALVRFLLDREPFDFFIAVFGETHRGGHILWPEGPGAGAIPADALLDVYRAVDEALGEILAAPALDDAGVIVFSLHGMGANTSQEHFVPRVMDLVNESFRGRRPKGPGNREGRPPPAIVRRLRERVPASIQNRVAHLVPVSVRDAVVNRSIVAGHDWAHTEGFDLLSDLNAYLRLNIRGRERDGIVERNGETFDRYVAWVRECFASLTIAGSGERLVEDLHLTRERFPGRRVDHLPDMVVTWSGHPPASRVESDRIGPVTAERATGRSGNHRRDGFCVVSVPGRQLPAPSDVRDLAPLVAAALQ
ncbi:MAG TPA: alkaline phosphatase family protein [Thermoanaerobaculia bacterium]